jgi:hypothetical protein
MMNTNETNNETVTRLRRIPVFPALTLVGSRPTVLGVSYDTYAEALAAKEANVEYITVDIFGREVR